MTTQTNGTDVATRRYSRGRVKGHVKARIAVRTVKPIADRLDELGDVNGLTRREVLEALINLAYLDYLRDPKTRIIR